MRKADAWNVVDGITPSKNSLLLLDLMKSFRVWRKAHGRADSGRSVKINPLAHPLLHRHALKQLPDEMNFKGCFILMSWFVVAVVDVLVEVAKHPKYSGPL